MEAVVLFKQEEKWKGKFEAALGSGKAKQRLVATTQPGRVREYCRRGNHTDEHTFANQDVIDLDDRSSQPHFFCPSSLLIFPLFLSAFQNASKCLLFRSADAPQYVRLTV